MKQNNKKFNNAMHKFVGVLDKYAYMRIKYFAVIYMYAELRVDPNNGCVADFTYVFSK